MVVLFGLAVVAIIMAIDLVAAAAWIWMHADDPRPRGASMPGLKSVPAWVYVIGALATGIAILLVSLWEIMSLRAGGGAAGARMGEARRGAPNTRDPPERRLLNGAEGMAIPAGTRVPGAFIKGPERSLNPLA